MIGENELGVLWRMSRGYRLRPWRSPYLKWRIETYSGLHADSIDFKSFWRFLFAERHELRRFLKWAGKMDARL